MGWASGGQLLEDVWGSVRKHIPENKRVKVLAEVISCFEDMDCDVTYELDGVWPEARKALELCGHEFDIEGDE